MKNMKKQTSKENSISTILFSVAIITMLQSIRLIFFPVLPLTRILEWMVPSVGFLIIPLIWLRVNKLSFTDLGMDGKWRDAKHLSLAFATGLLGFLPFLNHQVIKGEPIIFTLKVFVVAIFMSVIYAPLRELFWRGFLQTNLQKIIKYKWLAFIMVTLLATIAEIPLFLSYGKTPITVIMPLFNNVVFNLAFGYVFYRTKNLQTVMIGHGIYNFGGMLAHGYEIVEMILR